jgi:hypothetical protein
MFNITTHRKQIDGPAILVLSGIFSGEKEEFEEIRDAFRKGGIVDSVNEVHLETTPTFYANGQAAYMAREIKGLCRGRIIICHDPKLSEVAHIFKK